MSRAHKADNSTRKLSRAIDAAFEALRAGQPDARQKLYTLLCAQAKSVIELDFQPAATAPLLEHEIADRAMLELDQFSGGKLSTWFSRRAHREAKSALKVVAKDRNKREEIKAPVIPENDAQGDSFSRWFREETERLAGEMDYSRKAAAKVLSDFFAAKASLDRLCTEVVPDLSKFLAIAQEDAEIAARLQNTILESVHLACYWLAVTQAATRVIFTRIKKNGTNSNFGFLLLGMLLGNKALYQQCHSELELIALSIPYKKKNWFHPNATDIWRNLANEVLDSELIKHQHLEVNAVLERMIENRFAYLYVAFKREFIDELRKLYRRRSREWTLPEESEISDSSGIEAIRDESEDEPISLEELKQEREEMEQQRDDVLKLIVTCQESPSSNPGINELLNQLRAYIEDPGKCFAPGHLGVRSSSGWHKHGG
jgi:DNA-directed RNA polymerase specialized sigma24 family protein